MKLYVDKEKTKFIQATLICANCKQAYPEAEMEEHVKNCKGSIEGNQDGN